MLQYNPTVSGSLTVTGTISATQGITGSFSGSIAGLPTDTLAFSSSLSTRITNTELTSSEYVSTSSSLSTRVTAAEATSSAFVTASGSLSTRVTATEATASAFVASSASFSTRLTTDGTSIASINAKTGSFATTGSNFFIGNQVITGSVYIANDLIVQGSSSLQNITASAVSIGTNTVILNTNTPILQFGGISVFDSGSTQGRSGSLLWNSINDHWINVNPSGSDEGYNSAMIINGPKNTGSLGNEAGLTLNYIPVSQGEDHITDSIIFQSGSVNIGIGTNVPTTKLNVLVDGSGNEDGITVGVGSQGDGIKIVQRYLSNRVVATLGQSNYSTATDSGALRLYDVGGTEKIRLSGKTGLDSFITSGNVGIGITNPARTLHLNSSSDTRLAITDDTIGTTSNDGTYYRQSGVNAYIVNQENGTFQIGTNNSYFLTSLASGNVGIGTASPGKRLEVSEDNASTTSTTGLKITNWSITTNTRAGIIFQNYDNIGAAIWSRRTGTTAGELIFGTNSGAGVTAETAVVERMRIDNTGATTFSSNVTAGTGFTTADGGFTAFTSGGNSGYSTRMSTAYNFPYVDSFFDSLAAASYEGRISFRTSTNGGALGTRMTILNNGNIGIGTTNPGSKLTVVGNTGIAGTLGIDQSNATPNIQSAGNGNEQGAAYNYKIVRHYPVVSSGTKLIIPFVYQGNLNSSTIIHVFGHAARWNARLPRGFSAYIEVGHLTVLSDLNSWGVGGNISSIGYGGGMNVEINFASAYTSATANGIYVTIEYMTNVPSYSIDVANIAMN